MLQEIKLVIKENGKVIETISKSTNTGPSKLIHSVQEVQKMTNDILTKMVESTGQDSVILDNDEVDDEDDNDEDTLTGSSPKKRKP